MMDYRENQYRLSLAANGSAELADPVLKGRCFGRHVPSRPLENAEV
jgi:hypothetical protein